MRKQVEVTHGMRSILVDWLVGVADEYHFHRQTLFLCINYIDRFLSTMMVVRAKLQLLGVAAMFLASLVQHLQYFTILSALCRHQLCEPVILGHL